ncbi:MAG: hypothetical protein GX141_00135 [Armatimonadetes bacterium]|jgi:hypothetical protein|nr:hypothetical protein [Armatimonadota bacterium]
MSDQKEEVIGRVWVAAILALLVLLIVGILLYLKMGAPLVEQPRRPATDRVSESIHHGSASCEDVGISLLDGWRV